MSSPCPRCGETKTDPVMHGLMYKLASAFGYHLRECARCRKKRFLSKHRENSLGSSHTGKAAVNALPFGEERGALRTFEENRAPEVTRQVTSADSSDRDSRRCPACGSADYHRTRRTKLERILRRPKVAHCEQCGLRFPFPGGGHRSSSSVKSGKAVATVPRTAEEKRAPKMAEENNQPEIKSQATGADSSKRGLRLCPACGNMKYHRTKRSTLEHLLFRPRMARCEKCGFRFPHPGRNEEYPAPLKVVEPKTIVPRPAEERSAPKMAEESSRPKITQEVRVVDYSNTESRCCPHCGKCKYHRSRPTTLDKILLRPAMAHCEVCGGRFPYPKHMINPGTR